MQKVCQWLFWLGNLFIWVNFSSCGKGQMMDSFQKVDSLNHRAYIIRYKDLNLSEQMAVEALTLAENYPQGKAQALNHLGFCRFMRMDFEQSDSLFQEVYKETSNELESLVADVGLMKICQRTAQNKEFYDYRNNAIRRIERIREDKIALMNPEIQARFNYAQSEFAITSSIYYYYLQQEQQSIDAIHEIDVEDGLEKDMAQLLYYYYMKGSGGLCEADTPEKILLEEFDYLLDCLTLSHEHGYVYFEANALQALAEILKVKENYDWLAQQRSGMMRVINQKDIPWENLAIRLAEEAMDLFERYGDWYQIAVVNRTLASCYAELGMYEKSLDYLTEALSYVNRHHEKYYHCSDTLDRLRPYIPMATNSIELEWINQEGIMTVPEWIARFREQLSVTYAALGLKPQSDYNRNIYLDILDYTRQDKELESRYSALQTETMQLNALLFLVVVTFLCLVVLLWIWNKRWRIRDKIYTDKLKITLEICRKITTSVPVDAEDMDDVINAIWTEVKPKLLALVHASDMEIIAGEWHEKKNEGYCLEIPLEASNQNKLGEWRIYTETPLKKDYCVLLQIIAPYISWTLENGLGIISLSDECKRLDKEKYIHEQHLIDNKRQNLVKKACFFIVTGIMPFIDRLMNEVHKLVSFNYLADKEIKESKYRYLDELVTCINEYNDILALWIKMRQGSLSLNIENFELDPLFDVLRKGKKNFESKSQTFVVRPTTAVVKADKALTLFMINTLAENARKYTQKGGQVEVYASEESDYVEISVQDNGAGLSAEDVGHILEEKIYDSGRIGLHTAQDVAELKKTKGNGFGLMNCKGIIEKYRKTSAIFNVCGFYIDSQIGKGSRFYFRLPKGVNRIVGICILCLLPFTLGCSQHSQEELSGWDVQEPNDTIVSSGWLDEANRLANKVYQSNLAADYQNAIVYADSALVCLNHHYQENSGLTIPLLTLAGEGEAAELEWFENHFYTDYYTLLDVRNEVAVACLALGLFDAYRYNNQAYTSLYKQISVDVSLEQYCEQMQKSASNKSISIVLCIALLMLLLLGYYILYFRHRLIYRYNLEQVFEVNRQVFSMPLFGLRESSEIASVLATGLYKEMNELVAIDVLGIAIYNEEQHLLCNAFSSSGAQEEEMREEIALCFQSSAPSWNKDNRIRCLPLCVKFGEEVQRMGVMAFRCVYETEREEDCLLYDLVANYVSIIAYNAVKLVAQKYRDVEMAQDEVRRVIREETQLHVQNLVLDNCLSTIKHETIYYPNKIKQIIDKLNQGLSRQEERQQVESISDLIGYYKEIFTMLSAWAARQFEEVTFRRSVVSSQELSEHAVRYFKRLTRKINVKMDFRLDVRDVSMIGDSILLKYLLENLLNEAVAYREAGVLELAIYREDNFVRIDWIDHRRQYTQEELNQLFYPHLSRMNRGEGGVTGTEYLICKQIIRDHDEFSGRRGCRMNADLHPDGGFVVWCTIPVK